MVRGITRNPIGLVHLVAVALQGCLAPLRVPFETSAPSRIPAGVEGKVGPDGRTTLRLEGLEMRLETRNQRPGGLGFVTILPLPVAYPFPGKDMVDDPKPLGPRQLLYLDLRAHEPGFAFNPMAVLFAADSEAAAPPLAYIGPGRPSWGCRDAGGEELERSTADMGYPIQPDGEWTCFVLAFRVSSSSPDVPFQLLLGGLQRSGEAVPPVELAFSKRKARSWLDTPRTWRPESLTR